MKHDLFDSPFGQVERAQNPVAVFLFDDAFGVSELESAGDFLADRQDPAVWVDLNPEEAQHASHEKPDKGYGRREDLDHHGNRPGDEGRGLLGIGDRVGLWQDLGKDQNKKRHHQRRKRHAGFAERPREEGSRERGRQNIDEVVPKEHRADQTLVVFGDLERAFCAFRPLFGLILELATRRGGQGGFRAGKEC